MLRVKMIIAPLWILLILLSIAGVVKLVYGQRWKKEAEDRKKLFEERQKIKVEDKREA
jgi:uncharacterized membrane protein